MLLGVGDFGGLRSRLLVRREEARLAFWEGGLARDGERSLGEVFGRSMGTGQEGNTDGEYLDGRAAGDVSKEPGVDIEEVWHLRRGGDILSTVMVLRV